MRIPRAAAVCGRALMISHREMCIKDYLAMTTHILFCFVAYLKTSSSSSTTILAPPFDTPLDLDSGITSAVIFDLSSVSSKEDVGRIEKERGTFPCY